MVICQSMTSSTSVVMGSKQSSVVARLGAKAAVFVNPMPDQSSSSSSLSSLPSLTSHSHPDTAATAAAAGGGGGAAASTTAGVGYFQPTGGDVPSIVLDPQQAAALYDYIKSTAR